MGGVWVITGQDDKEMGPLANKELQDLNYDVLVLIESTARD